MIRPTRIRKREIIALEIKANLCLAFSKSKAPGHHGQALLRWRHISHDPFNFQNRGNFPYAFRAAHSADHHPAFNLARLAVRAGLLAICAAIEKLIGIEEKKCR